MVFTRALKTGVRIIERVISAFLVVLILLGLLGLGVELAQMLHRHVYLDVDDVTHVLDHVLALFILVELFAIALAYVDGRRILRTVLEATLVAVARKLIAFEPGEGSLSKGLVLALLLLGTAAAWYLLHRIGATSESSRPRPAPRTAPGKQSP